MHNKSNKLQMLMLTIAVVSYALLGGCSKEPEKTKVSQAQLPMQTPKEMVKNLYKDSLFFNLAIPLSQEALAYLTPFLTTELAEELQQFKSEVEVWMEAESNKGLKLPASESPLFLRSSMESYAYQIEEALIEGDLARVPISFSVSDVRGAAQWKDTVVLKRGEKSWLLDDIYFTPEGASKTTLRSQLNRISSLKEE